MARVRKSAALPGLDQARWDWAVLPLVPRFITVLPLSLSLIKKKAGAAGLGQHSIFLDRC